MYWVSGRFGFKVTNIIISSVWTVQAKYVCISKYFEIPHWLYKYVYDFKLL